jgi:hypothetical protein
MTSPSQFLQSVDGRREDRLLVVQRDLSLVHKRAYMPTWTARASVWSALDETSSKYGADAVTRMSPPVGG